MPDPADYLRRAAESDVSADEAWEEQRELNEHLEFSLDDVSARSPSEAESESGREAEQ